MCPFQLTVNFHFSSCDAMFVGLFGIAVRLQIATNRINNLVCKTMLWYTNISRLSMVGCRNIAVQHSICGRGPAPYVDRKGSI